MRIEIEKRAAAGTEKRREIQMNGDRQTDLFILVCLVAGIARRRNEMRTEKK